MISRDFDTAEAQRRYKEYGSDALDDEKQPLVKMVNGMMEQQVELRYLEVAHIIPHSLGSSVRFLPSIESGNTKIWYLSKIPNLTL